MEDITNTSTKLLALGSNGSGQLGITHVEDVCKPTVVVIQDKLDSPVVRSAGGGNHTLLITESGSLFYAGANPPQSALTSKRLDHPIGEHSIKHNFVRVPSGFRGTLTHAVDDVKRPDSGHGGPVRLIAATWDSSILVQADEHGMNRLVSTYGKGDKGELGLGKDSSNVTDLTPIKDFPPPQTEIVDIASGMGHVAVVLSNGAVYGWGNGRKGQLSLPAEVVLTPRKFENIPFKVVRAVCGREFTCLFGPSASGDVVILGADKFGLQNALALNSIMKWKDVGANWGTLHILREDGTVLSLGRDDHGQKAPRDLPHLNKIAVGSEHVVALTRAGDVVAWGWGEHGNCGSSNVEQCGVVPFEVKGAFNTLLRNATVPAAAEAGFIGAGWATTWMAIRS